jgi:ribulose-5-phosphate 4-epimerase/fuculose-1-phosphate aldolase
MASLVDDGVIKYRTERRDGELPAMEQFDALNRARTTLFDWGLVGAYPDGVGYGNLSLRYEGTQFAITASATGSHRTLARAQYCLVESFSISENRVWSRGSLHASSESMTHGAIYAACSSVQCVMHVHSRSLFNHLLQTDAPNTPANIPYGTPAMARRVSQLVSSQDKLPVLFVMAGHDEGVVAYGTSIAAVLALLEKALQSTLGVLQA